MPDEVGLAEVFYGDSDIGHGSDQVSEALFHLAELADTQPEEEDDQEPAEQEAGQVQAGFTAKDGPAEAVDDADDRVEGIQQTPRIRHNGRAEAHRRHVQAKLHNERDDVAKVAVFDVQRGDPKPRP